MQESTNEVDASQQTASPSVGNLATKLLQSKNTQVTLTSQTLSLAALSEDQLLNKMLEQIQSMEVKDGVADLVRIFNCYVSKRIAQIKISAAAKMSTDIKCQTCNKKTVLNTLETQTEDRAEIQGENPNLAKKGKGGDLYTMLKTHGQIAWEEKQTEDHQRNLPLPPLLYKPMENGIRTNISNGGTPVVLCLLINQSKAQRAGADPNIIGDRIISLQQARNGGVIIQVRGGQDAAQIVRDEVIRTTNQANVKTIQRRGLIEVRDMDVLTTKEELAKDLAKELGLDINEINVINLRSSFCETQTGTVLIPIKATIEAEKKIRTRVGVVYCRVRQLKGRVRCYRCLGLGHEARNCNETDRKGNCNKCGKKGHFARECKAKREEVDEFNAELAAETAKPTTNTTANIDWIIASKYYRYGQNTNEANGWYCDKSSRAAIVNCGDVGIEEIGKAEHGFMWITTRNVRIYTYYISPNITITEYQNCLARLEINIRIATCDVIVAGDFNAKHRAWGSRVNNDKGESLSDLTSSLGLIICNQGGRPTWQRNDSKSYIDVTMTSANLAARVKHW
ncbi:hypothetical protein QTP88_016549 [Uroleucon formosanum]